jgi:hypothetical protein
VGQLTPFRRRKMEHINKYLNVSGYFLGVEDQRYGGGYRAIIGNRYKVNWLFELMECDGFDSEQVETFLCENPIFPSSYGENVSSALIALDKKLSMIFDFTPEGKANPKFNLEAEYDDSTEKFTVSWNDIMDDVCSAYEQHKGGFFYEEAKKNCSTSKLKCLYSLINCNFRFES